VEARYGCSSYYSASVDIALPMRVADEAALAELAAALKYGISAGRI